MEAMIDDLILNFFNPEIVRRVWPFLLQGFTVTLGLSALVIPLGLAGGLGIAILHSLRLRWLNVLLIAYVDLFRALPPLVLLIFIYFGAPFLGLDLPKLVAVAIAFLLNTSSYYGEVFRAGIESVSAGQAAAARSTGLSRGQTMWSVILPQASRNVLPDLVSNTLEVIKLTSLASVVALPELLNNARQAQALTYNATPIVLAALFYLVLLWPIVRLLSRLEHKSLAQRQ
jgi:polar amino acid transport system permease protein